MTDHLVAIVQELIDSIREESGKDFWEFSGPPIEFTWTPGDGPCVIIDNPNFATLGGVLDAVRDRKGIAAVKLSEFLEELKRHQSVAEDDELLSLALQSCNPVNRISRHLAVAERAILASSEERVISVFHRLLSSLCYHLKDQQLHREDQLSLPWAMFILQPEPVDEDLLGALKDSVTEAELMIPATSDVEATATASLASDTFDPGKLAKGTPAHSLDFASVDWYGMLVGQNTLSGR